MLSTWMQPRCESSRAGPGLLAAPELGTSGVEQHMSHECSWELISL